MARISERDAALLGLGARASGPIAARALSRSRALGLPASVRAPRPHPKTGRLPRIPPIDARTLEFVVNTDPIPKARARTQLPMGQIVKCFVQARGNLMTFQALLEKVKHQTFTPERTKAFESEVALVANRAMASARRAPLTVPIRMAVTFVLRGDPGTWPTAEVDGDLDNLVKAVKDALNKIAYSDDRLVVEVSMKKICGPEPRVEVSVGPA